MQEALPYKSGASSSYRGRSDDTNKTVVPQKVDDLKKLVSQNPVIVFGMRGCCMICVVNHLLQGQGVNPAIFEIDVRDEEKTGGELQVIAGKEEKLKLPVVFIGGKLFGGVDQIMAAHINGHLVPVLKEAGALWL